MKYDQKGSFIFTLEQPLRTRDESSFNAQSGSCTNDFRHLGRRSDASTALHPLFDDSDDDEDVNDEQDNEDNLVV